MGNVYLGSYGEYVSPGIQEDENHNLHYVPSENMWDDAHENNTLKQSFKFRNPEEAARFVNGKHSGIRRGLTGRNKTHRGFHFVRAEEDDHE